VGTKTTSATFVFPFNEFTTRNSSAGGLTEKQLEDAVRRALSEPPKKPATINARTNIPEHTCSNPMPFNVSYGEFGTQKRFGNLTE
jgi:hypothetical protein